MRQPRQSRERQHRRSPLAQVHHTRPLSTGPDHTMAAAGGVVRDPLFWKRFSVAVHKAEDVEKAPKSAVGSVASSNA